MAHIKGISDGHGVHTVEMTLHWREAAYVLACLGASNTQLFDEDAGIDVLGEDGSSTSLYGELRDVLGVEPVSVSDRKANPPTRLFRQISTVLDAWCGKRNYAAARRVAEEMGL